MIKNSLRQSGSAHAVIIVILVVVLLGALAFIFWQNFSKNDNATTPVATSATNETPVVTNSYKTYTTDVYGVSFQYPDNWILDETVKSDEENNVSRSTTITTKGGTEVDFTVGIRGLGGYCDTPTTYKVLDTSSTTIRGEKTVHFSLTLQPNSDGSFNGYYGLTDRYTTIGDVQACPNTFYYVFSPTDDNYGLIQFNAKKSFVDLGAANDYVNSDEYKAVKKMITSLSY